MRRGIAVAVASGFGVGYVPVAPGTAGSLVALVLGYGLLHLGWLVLVGAAVLATILGIWAVHATGALDDPGWVVMDEFAGQWIALLALPAAEPIGAAAAFVLFRLYDIAKPGLVGLMDRRGDAAGVVLDDVVAGALAAATLAAARALLMAMR